jgi:hypothetical protein
MASQIPQVQKSNAAVGLTVFAAIVMMIAGFSQVIMGLVALFNDQFFVVGKEYIFTLDTTTWGWIHLLLGALVCAAGFGLFAGAVWARTVGVIIAIVAVMANFLWIPFTPVWSLMIIALNMYVIWALTAHGTDITKLSD